MHDDCRTSPNNTPFWAVMSSMDGGRGIQQVHLCTQSLDKAKNAARTLARQHPGKHVYICTPDMYMYTEDNVKEVSCV